MSLFYIIIHRSIHTPANPAHHYLTRLLCHLWRRSASPRLPRVAAEEAPAAAAAAAAADEDEDREAEEVADARYSEAEEAEEEEEAGAVVVKRASAAQRAVAPSGVFLFTVTF